MIIAATPIKDQCAFLSEPRNNRSIEEIRVREILSVSFFGPGRAFHQRQFAVAQKGGVEREAVADCQQALLLCDGRPACLNRVKAASGGEGVGRYDRDTRRKPAICKGGLAGAVRAGDDPELRRQMFRMTDTLPLALTDTSCLRPSGYFFTRPSGKRASP